MKFFRNIFRDRESGAQDVQVIASLIFFDSLSSTILIKLTVIPLQVKLEISFMEAVEGCTKTINFNTYVTCETCSMYMRL
jgi:molecular chaperone DnaJ